MRGKGEGGIEALPNGLFKARFTVGYLPSGNPRRETKTFKTKREARQWLADRQAQRVAGDLTAPNTLTFAAWTEQYLRGLTVRPNTRHDYEKALEPALASLGALRLRELTPAVLQGALNTWRSQRTPYQNRKSVKLLKAVLAEAVRLELLVRNPAAPLKAPRVESAQVLVWWADEAEQMLDHVRARDHRLYLFIHLNLVTGLRREEMIGLRWQDVDLEARELHVRQTVTYLLGQPQVGEPKTPKSRRTVDLDQDTVAVLRAWARRQAMERQVAGPKWTELDLVFTTPIGHIWAETYLAKVFRQLMDGAGVPRIRLYDLRHSYASMAYEAGVPLKLISDRMGHENIAFTLKTYVHSSKRQRQATAWSAEQLFAAARRGVEVVAEGAPFPTSATNLPPGPKKRRDAV